MPREDEKFIYLKPLQEKPKEAETAKKEESLDLENTTSPKTMNESGKFIEHLIKKIKGEGLEKE